MPDEARCTVTVTIHPWCRDIPRDEAVRAAEDGRPGPLPTLDEAISRAGQFAPSEAPQEQKCTERESGMRTERVTLEVTHGESFGVSHWSWVTILRLQSGETVRVVEDQRESHLAAQRGVIDTLTRQRDAAIRERDQAKQHHARECAKCVALADKVIGLKARVAELESAAKLAPAANADGVSNPRPISGLGKSAVEETQEPDAWGVRRKGGVDAVVHRLFRSSAEQSAEQYGGTVVPLYAAPQAASGAAGTEPVAWGVILDGKIDRHAGSDALFTDKEEADEWCHDAALSNRGTVLPLYAAPQAASGAAGTEPDAWSIRWDGQTEIDCEFVYTNPSGVHEILANNDGSGTVVPLYSAPVAESATTPQTPRGWLTAEERETLLRISYSLDYVQFATSADFIRSLLARSSPPEVVLPALPPYAWSNAAGPKCGWDDCMGIVRYALAAAGVTVKEVGK